MSAVPDSLCAYPVHLEDAGAALVYRGGDGTGKGKAEVAALAQALAKADIAYVAFDQRESSLEDIFVDLLENPSETAAA